ncbi:MULTISPECIES: hypothetical protein [Streptomyces]|uniref:Uncharacterized protein n=1 Tax=Streptomyces mutomycini TaxID=284036 RepID=A0ABW0B7P5_9ACTN|nr:MULTISPECIES: hypothetical protein [Streptomyces]
MQTLGADSRTHLGVLIVQSGIVESGDAESGDVESGNATATPKGPVPES